MAKFQADESNTRWVMTLLHKRKGLRHLRTRRRADVITIESGPTDDAFPHARMRRVGVHLWALEMPTHRGKWEPTDVRADIETVIRTLIDDFGWTLAPVDDDPRRTSDRQD